MSRSPSVGKPRSPLETIDGKETTLKLSMPIYGLPSEQKKAILSEAQVMLRTGEVFVIGGGLLFLLRDKICGVHPQRWGAIP